MKLRRRRPASDVAASIKAATQAREDANTQLAEARDVIAVQGERARHERATIITGLRKMREQNNLARLILDTVEQETGTGHDTSAAGGGAHQ